MLRTLLVDKIWPSVKRRFFNLLSALSLLLFAALVAIWIWSYFPSITAADPPNGPATVYPPPHAVSYPAVVEGYEYVVPMRGTFQLWTNYNWMGKPTQSWAWGRDVAIPMEVPAVLLLVLLFIWLKQKWVWQLSPSFTAFLWVLVGSMLIFMMSTLV
jgi:hypothetical protein